MAKKKGVKKKVSKKKIVKKKVSKKKVARSKPKSVSKKISKSKPIGKVSVDKKLKFSVRRLLFFVIVTLLAYVLYLVSSDVYAEAFQLAIIIFGAISIAFLIIVLVLFFLKKSSKKS